MDRLTEQPIDPPRANTAVRTAAPPLARLTCAVLAFSAAAMISIAQQAPTDQQQAATSPPAPAGETTEAKPPRRGAQGSQPEHRRAIGDLLARRLEQAQRAETRARDMQEKIRRAQALLEQGTAAERIRELYPELDRGSDRRGGDYAAFTAEAEPWSAQSFLSPLSPPRPAAAAGTPPPDSGNYERPPTADERAELKTILERTMPMAARMLGELERRDPERAMAKYREMFGRVGWLLELRQRDPTLFELRVNDLGAFSRALEAAHAAARSSSDGPADDEARGAAARERLRQVLTEQYRTRTQIEAHELSIYRARIDARVAANRARPELESRVVGAAAELMIERARSHGKGASPLLERLRDRRESDRGG